MLREINVPLEFIGNTERLKIIQRELSESDKPESSRQSDTSIRQEKHRKRPSAHGKIIKRWEPYRFIKAVLKGYNNKKHSTIKMAPAEVDDSNVYIVWKNIHKRTRHRKNRNFLLEIALELARREWSLRRDINRNGARKH